MLAGKLMGVVYPFGPLSFIGYKHREAVFDGEADAASLADQMLVLPGEVALASWVERAAQES